MRIRLNIILFFLFTSCINFVKAQQQIFKNYTVNDGLISNDIRRIFQDSKGFLWIGTMEGLSKYDGNVFTNYTKLKGLSHSVVNDIYESENGRLYVALNNGIIDEIRDDKVVPGKAKAPVIVNRFIKTPWQKVIALTDSYGFQNFRNGQLTKPTQQLPDAIFFDAVILSDSSFAATEINSLKVFNKNFKLLSQIKIPGKTYSSIKCYKDSKGRLWVVPAFGIQLIEFVPGSNLHLSNRGLTLPFKFLNKYNISDIFEDDQGNMWFATSEGIVKVNIDGSNQIFTINDGLTSNIIKTIFQDKEKNLWFGTAVGLSKLVTKSGITLFPIEKGVWQNDYQFLMYPYKEGHFLVGTSRGTKDFNKITGILSTAFKNNDAHFYQAVLNTNPLILTGDTKSVTFDTLLMQPHTIPALSSPSNIRILICDKTGNSFTGNFDGLFFNSEKGLQKISDDRISGLLIDRNNNLWAGTWQDGLFRFQYRVINKNIQILETRYFLPGINVRTLYEDVKGDIWAGSRYHGCFRLTKNEKDSFNILNISQSDGLTSNFIKSIREDANGNFWIAFYQGLDKLLPKKNSFQIFNFSRVNNFFTSIIGMEIDNDNLLWLATAEGIIRIKDGEMEKLYALPVYITKVYSSDSTFALHSLHLQFNYRQKDLQFDYSSPDYINEKQIMYSYRLIGKDEVAWSSASNHHTVSFADLSPGKYQFQVKSLGWNGAWGLPAIVDFVITPPFWQTWWFISLVLLSLATLTYLLIRWRIKNIRTVAGEKLKLQQVEAEKYKNELDLEQVINNSRIEIYSMNEQLSKAKLEALRSQMNPHFIFNCINSIDGLIQSNDKYYATVYLNKFAKLIRNILDSSKKDTVTLSKDLETLQLYIEMEKFRNENKFTADIDADDELLQDDYKVPPLIIQPFVENAILHGLRFRNDNNGHLSIRVTRQLKCIQYIIEDNGVGRNTNNKHIQKDKTSYGISMSNERVRLFNKEEKASVKIIDLIKDGESAGTRVEVSLKIEE